ncbi:GNAT family N-acetyltransferase [Lysobacter sp. F6437]|uniref:GNAT family N-acetyltransferase n=1 Tax=Lysobacter sp. F6437 TaxID=3459296 RepID=UPI00403D8121
MAAFQTRIVANLHDIPADQWDALHDGRNPFVAHSFLAGLERHGCVRSDWGWTPRHLTLWQGDQLVAAAPGYLKDNSHGEFVFDHAWAHAYAQHGLDYFPKWLCAVPYSPVPGPRLLARDPAHRIQLLDAMARLAALEDVSSAHVNFHRDDEATAFTGDWLARIDVQYHWRNDSGWRGFDDYLAAFDHKHRKNIRQERARVARAGIRFRVVDGADASDADLAIAHRFYLQTFAEYGNHPALTLPFLQHLRDMMPRSLVLFLAERVVADGVSQPIAGAICLRGGDTLYGRYWGSSETVPGLHFETCYYQGIEYCLREGLTRFEPGAQGEHKLARGFLPNLVHSRHWIAHDAFRDALRDWCAQEAASVRRYAATLAAHSPFKRVGGDHDGHADPTAAASD